MGRKKQNWALDEIQGMFKEGLTRASTRPTVHNYVPHEKQVKFHSSPAKGRLYIGGNRSGKTVGGIVEDVMRLRGVHPYLNVPEAPIRGRIVCVSYNEGIKEIILPELAKWLPPSDLINGSWEDSYNKGDRKLTLANGSFCELMSYDQDVEKFAGTSRHFIHYDEEPPKAIFDECKMRLLDTKGHWYITMTPVEGMTWVHDDIYEPGLLPGSNIDVIVIDTEENPYISKAEIDIVMEGLGENEIKARKEGKFVSLGHLAFKQFQPHHIIKELLPPLDWTHYASMDHGLNNPTVWLWHAVRKDGLVVTYDEIYANERSVDSFAAEVIERNKWAGRRTPDIYVGDPAIAQRNAQTMDSIQTAYAMAGVPIVLGNNDQKIGVEKMNRYFSQNKWLITENCWHLTKELQRQRWKIYETAKKRYDNPPREELDRKHSHAPDSARYFFSLMNEMYLPLSKDTRVEDINSTVKNLVMPVTVPHLFNTDPNLGHGAQTPTEWRKDSVDEYLGAYW